MSNTLFTTDHHVFIGSSTVLRVKSGDILTLIGGLVFVIVIAVLVNPGYLSGMQAIIKPSPPTDVSVITPRTLEPTVTSPIIQETTITPTVIPKTTGISPIPDAQPYRIFYTSTPFSYPRYTIPDDMGSFAGVSGPPTSQGEMVPFAFVEGTKGGVTRNFSVPYPFWVLNISMTANRFPQYGNFRMVLADASNGKIIDGAEILNRGSTYLKIPASHTNLYMIISTADIDFYRITLETPRKYYDEYRTR